jgi:hypothetical protein
MSGNIWNMADAQAKLLALAIEKAESELRAQKNQEHCSLLAVKITTLRFEETQNSLETSKLMLKHWQEVDSVKKLPKMTGGFSS